MAMHRLRSITIGVPEVEAVRGFYRDFGLDEVAPGRFATADGGEQLRFVAAPRRTLVSLAVGVDDANDLGRASESLAKLGVQTQRDAAGLRATEPVSGIAVELVVEPRVSQKSGAGAVANRPGAVVRHDARAPAVSAAPSRPRRLQHVVFTSSDPLASRRFFTDGLGFRVSDEIPAFGATFLRCSTDHHNVLVQPGPFSFLHHTAWEMDDVDAVGRAAASMVAADAARHVWGLGRHAIGSNFFWYLRDPAGNFAEYSADLDVIADAEAWKVAASTPAHGLAAWAPPVPASFLAPEDILALVRG
jgi:catechol 2,3-dioxygenase-like lactoylglutathione lyase family enzyme